MAHPQDAARRIAPAHAEIGPGPLRHPAADRPGRRQRPARLVPHTGRRGPRSRPYSPREHGGWQKLGLRRHAVPAPADMCRKIGGIRCPAAPFNHWYMGIETGARNLADAGRYDLLP